MKVNVLQPLTNYEGKPLEEDKKPVLLRSVIINALNYTPKEGKQLSAEEKIGIYKLSVDIFNSDEIELTSEQISKIKANCAAMYGSLITGQVCLILEGEMDFVGSGTADPLDKKTTSGYKTTYNEVTT